MWFIPVSNLIMFYISLQAWYDFFSSLNVSEIICKRLTLTIACLQEIWEQMILDFSCVTFTIKCQFTKLGARRLWKAMQSCDCENSIYFAFLLTTRQARVTKIFPTKLLPFLFKIFIQNTSLDKPTINPFQWNHKKFNDDLVAFWLVILLIKMMLG